MWCASAGASSGDNCQDCSEAFPSSGPLGQGQGLPLGVLLSPSFFCCWLVCCSVSDVDGAQGFGLRSSWNSMNWFAQIVSFTLTGMCAAMGVEALTKK